MAVYLSMPRIGETSLIKMNIDDAQQDPFRLDGLDLKDLKKRPQVIVSNEPIEPAMEEVSIQYIALPVCSALRRICVFIPRSGWLLDWILNFYVAVRLVIAMRRRDAMGLISLGKRSGSLFCLLNSFKGFRGGPVVVYRVLWSAHSSRLVNYLIGRALGNVSLIALWSRTQIENYHRVFSVPRIKFVFIPYKANHSKAPSIPIPVGDYIFSGGNSERDYKTLFEAVQGLPIPVIVSATKSSVIQGLNIPENVILVRAQEPAFERLMAGSRMVALCLKDGIIRGSGEPTILNAMWHRKPVVVADNVAAAEYVNEGVDGFVVPAGNAEQMRRRILELWKDPQLMVRMGEAGRKKAANFYTHHQWNTRIQALAMLVFESQS